MCLSRTRCQACVCKTMTYLNANGTVHIHQGRILEFLLYFMNLRIAERPPNQSLQATDGVTEVRGL